MPSAESNVKQFLTRKVGPAPMYVWIGTAIVGYYLFRHFKGSGSRTTVAPTTTGASGQATDTGASGGGGGTPVDQTPSDLGPAFSDLTQALIASSGAIAGLGAQALQSGQAAQEAAVYSSYTPSSYSAYTPYGSAGAGYDAPAANAGTQYFSPTPSPFIPYIPAAGSITPYQPTPVLQSASSYAGNVGTAPVLQNNQTFGADFVSRYRAAGGKIAG